MHGPRHPGRIAAGVTSGRRARHAVPGIWFAAVAGVASRFRDRREAGGRLARRLSAYAGQPDVMVLALPRGGVPVAREVARELRAPLDVFLVRKLGVPFHRELAMGAIATDRKSTRLNSSHRCISYAVFCLKKNIIAVDGSADHGGDVIV